LALLGTDEVDEGVKHGGETAYANISRALCGGGEPTLELTVESTLRAICAR
jgi:hypothetical protein